MAVNRHCANNNEVPKELAVKVAMRRKSDLRRLITRYFMA